MTGEPILIRCEGSGCPPTATWALSGMCSMCGHWMTAINNEIPEHTRDDIVARLKRGDFG